MSSPGRGPPVDDRAPWSDLESAPLTLPGAPPRPSQADAEPTPTTTAPPPGPTPTTNNRGNTWSFVFLLVWLFTLTLGGGDDLLVRSQYRETLHILKQQRGNFSAWLWGEDSNFTLVSEEYFVNAELLS